MAILGNTPSHVILDGLTPTPDGNLDVAMKTMAAYNMADLIPHNGWNVGASVSAALPNNQGAFTGNITTSAHQQPFNYKSIEGQMFTVMKSITREQFERWPPERIKKEMLRQLVDEMYSSKYIEFTMQKDTLESDMVKVKARIFVTPDSQVRLLRENGY